MDPKALGEKIRALRRAKGLTQDQLAERANMGLRVIQRIEHGQPNTRQSTLVRVAQALGTTLNALYGVAPADAFQPFRKSETSGGLSEFDRIALAMALFRQASEPRQLLALSILSNDLRFLDLLGDQEAVVQALQALLKAK